MENVAYFDCFSGASGNMILGALLDVGLSLEDLRTELNKLNISGFDIKITQVEQHGISATHVEVVTEETHVYRHLHDIVEILERSSLAQQVKDDAQKIFTRLAEAEAKVHHTTIEHIHFHEVGALDAIVDVVGAVAGLNRLGVQKVYVSPFSLGTGFTVCAHGKIPVPVPATVELLKDKPVRFTEIEAELVTPTGAAILSTLGEPVVTQPTMSFQAVGYGAGTRKLPIPNVLRLLIGRVEEVSGKDYEYDTVSVIEANIDDMNPQLYEYLFERLFASGALDVYTMPVLMKKTRPGIVLSVLATPALKESLINLILRETTTIGVRWRDMSRVKAQREIHTVETQYGQVRVKVSYLGNTVINVAPEFEDCKQLAQTHPDVPLKQIYQEALQKGITEVS